MLSAKSQGWPERRMVSAVAVTRSRRRGGKGLAVGSMDFKMTVSPRSSCAFFNHFHKLINQRPARPVRHIPRLTPAVTSGTNLDVYRSLDSSKIVETVSLLRDRIKERFPHAGLGKVADDLLHVAEKSTVMAKTIARPLLLLRLAIGILAAIFVALLAWILSHLKNFDPD